MLFTLNVEFNGKFHHSGSLESDGYVYHMLVSDVRGIIQAGGQRIGNSIFLEVFPGQDENFPSDGVEQFLFSDTSEENDKGDNQPSISICEFSEGSGGVLSDYDSENAENYIGIEELDDDKVGLTMDKQVDNLQGSYFKFTTIKQEDKIKEVIKFAVDQVFENVDHFRSILRRYAIEEGIKLVKIKNDKRKVTQKCSSEICPFRIRASLDYDGHTFRIKKLCDDHTCVNDIKGIGVSSLWIVEQFLEDFKLNINFTPEQMNDKLITEYGIHVSSKKLYIYTGSYALIPRYGQAILDSNPQAWVKMKYSSI
ncbi:hypothetical protein LIER_22621 [Lithospermum erythrorhizon]|uniref:Transposase MuDR plant domain-containing protein n=1 Tax=Lithospermum erythrorhizon TaxID=34254 RepID=A0AAV3QX31_LITER